MHQPEEASASFLPLHDDFDDFWAKICLFFECPQRREEAPELSESLDLDAAVIDSLLDFSTSSSEYTMTDAEERALLEHFTRQNPHCQDTLFSLAKLSSKLEAQCEQPDPTAYVDVCHALETILDKSYVLDLLEQRQIVNMLHVAFSIQQAAIEGSGLSQPDRFAYQIASGYLAAVAKKALLKVTVDGPKLEAEALYKMADKAVDDVFKSWGFGTDPIDPTVNAEPTPSPLPQAPLDSITLPIPELVIAKPESTDAPLPPSQPTTARRPSPKDKAMESLKQSFCNIGPLTRAYSLPNLPSSTSGRSWGPHQPFKAFPRGNNLRPLPGIKE